MKRFLLLLAPLAALAGLVHAQEAADPQERLRQVRRDLPLIEKLVHSGLELAAEESFLERVETCNRLARDFAAEIKQALDRDEGSRVTFLGEPLRNLLIKGIAHNLDLARKELPKDPVRKD